MAEENNYGALLLLDVARAFLSSCLGDPLGESAETQTELKLKTKSIFVAERGPDRMATTVFTSMVPKVSKIFVQLVPSGPQNVPLAWERATQSMISYDDGQLTRTTVVRCSAFGPAQVP